MLKNNNNNNNNNNNKNTHTKKKKKTSNKNPQLLFRDHTHISFLIKFLNPVLATSPRQRTHQ